MTVTIYFICFLYVVSAVGLGTFYIEASEFKSKDKLETFVMIILALLAPITIPILVGACLGIWTHDKKRDRIRKQEDEDLLRRLRFAEQDGVQAYEDTQTLLDDPELNKFRTVPVYPSLKPKYFSSVWKLW
jgi:hypothetical protein